MWRIWFAACFWGFNWAAVRLLLDGVSPWTLRAIGLSGGFAVLSSLVLITGRSMALPRASIPGVLIGGALNITAFNIFAVFAQLSMPTSRAAIVTFTMPLWAALFAWIWLREPIDRVRALSLTVGAFGLGLLSVAFWPTLARGGIPWGLLYALGAAICWALGTVYFKKQPMAGDPLAAIAWQVGVGAAACILAMLAFETPRIDLSDPKRMAALAYHIILPQGLVYVVWFGLLARVPASTAALGTLLIPIFGVIGAIVILGDWPTPLDVGGLALILAAVGGDALWRRRSR
ncbi:MAG: DMT family transporter [Hyphomicrobiaceae bacterium]|nr:DMT family transporter [Hyphomicrobiaceae bacterium]